MFKKTDGRHRIADGSAHVSDPRRGVTEGKGKGGSEGASGGETRRPGERKRRERRKGKGRRRGPWREEGREGAGAKGRRRKARGNPDRANLIGHIG